MNIAPVAEYKGVAICELKGDKRAVWEGKEYHTDGLTWLVVKDVGALTGETDQGSTSLLPAEPNGVPMSGFSSERNAKQFIDSLKHPSQCFFSKLEVLILTKHTPDQIERLWSADELYEWDEIGGHFVRSPAMKAEGMRRINPLAALSMTPTVAIGPTTIYGLLSIRRTMAIWANPDGTARGPILFFSIDKAKQYCLLVAGTDYLIVPLELTSILALGASQNWTHVWAVEWRKDGYARYRSLPVTEFKGSD